MDTTPKITVRLAGKDYEVPQLTLGQLKALAVGVALPDVADPQQIVGRSFDRMVAVISAALIEAHPTMTPEALFKLRISKDEYRAANEAVMRFSGFQPPQKTAAELRAELAELQRQLAEREAEEKAEAAKGPVTVGEALAGA